MNKKHRRRFTTIAYVLVLTLSYCAVSNMEYKDQVDAEKYEQEMKQLRGNYE